MLGVAAAAVTGIGLSAGVPLLVIALLFVWGAAFGGIPTLLQTRLLHTASARVRDVGAALLTTAFNVGIGGGAAIGGALFVVLPTPALALAQASIIGFGLALLVVVDLVRARRTHTAVADEHEADESSVPLITGSIVLPEHSARTQHERRDPR
jgi:predicted MFS family arabinose efflux permease